LAVYSFADKKPSLTMQKTAMMNEAELIQIATAVN
jgi:hypothetical protein